MPTLVGQASAHFTWHECECHSDPPVPVPDEYLENCRAVLREVERIRRVCGNKPLTMSRLYSTRSHNESIPGHAENSQHLYANAADILPPEGMTVLELARIVQMLANEPESRVRYIKHYPEHHVHLDCRRRQDLIVEGL